MAKGGHPSHSRVCQARREAGRLFGRCERAPLIRSQCSELMRRSSLLITSASCLKLSKFKLQKLVSKLQKLVDEQQGL